MKNLKRNCHNEASLFKASCGYLVRLLHVVRNDSSRGAMSSPPSRRSNESGFRIKLTRSEVVELLAKRAAMFGLDARIALAIFGALSVISGAALYSAIQNVRVTAIIAEINEIAKAEEQYYLDTGSDLPEHISSERRNVRRIKNLVEQSVSIANWNGPYLSLDVNSEEVISSSLTDLIAITIEPDTVWGADVNGLLYTDGEVCSSCYIWVQYNVNSFEIADAIDKRIDGEKGRDSGNVRVRNLISTYTKPSLFIKYRPWVGSTF